MSKFYILGGLLCIGGLMLVGFQAISSMMTAGKIVWKSLSLVKVVGIEHLKWIDGISVHFLQNFLKYITTMPLYILLLCVGGLSFIVGGVVDK